MAMAVGHYRKSYAMWMPLVIGLALVAASGGGAATLNVPSDAYPTIQAGIDGAAAGDVVVVAAGRYKENIDFKGKAITVQSSNPTSPAVVAATIIDGDQKGRVVTFWSFETNASVLAGFTITNGAMPNSVGGGVYCEGPSSPTVRNNIITGNSAGYSGGGVFLGGSSPTLANNIISGNTAGRAVGDAQGGGVCCSGGTLTGNTISDNSATDGGGVYCNNAILTGNTITRNTASTPDGAAGGGGVWCGGAATLTNNTITNNTVRAVNGDASGGGVHCWDSTVISHNTITGNSAYTGAGVCCYGNSLTLTDNTISGNTAISNYGRGGGVFCNSATIANNLIEDNSATGEAGGVYCQRSVVTITANTIRGNSALLHGGGVRCDDVLAPSVVSDNTISGNSAASGGGLLCSSTTATLSNNTISGNSSNGTEWYDGGGGVFCDCSALTLTNNTISDNTAYGGGGVRYTGFEWATYSNRFSGNTVNGNSATFGGGVFCDERVAPALDNNTIADNAATYGGGVFCFNYASPLLTNNTISGNTATYGGGVSCVGSSGPIIENSIIAFSSNGGGLYVDVTLYPDNPCQPVITYSDVYGNVGGEYVNWPDQTGTNGNICLDPCFVSAAQSKFYLRSQAGHWNGAAWVNDTVTSPCIDAGDPASPFANEPAPNGGRMNMG
ncbi:MAG: right-handed parallel beta-helix repeat-containing protein [Armatimonadia bacterium]